MANELAKALCGFYADVGVIQQAAKSNYGQFADLPTVLTTVLPALAKHDLIQSQTFEPGPDGTTILVTTRMHVSGESIVSRLPLILGRNSNAMFALGGAITYFRRYALLSILGLSADVEADPEDYVEPATPAPVAGTEIVTMAAAAATANGSATGNASPIRCWIDWICSCDWNGAARPPSAAP